MTTMNIAPAFNASIFEAEDTVEFTVRHPVTDAPTTWIWTIAGPGHPRIVERDGERLRKDLNEQRKREAAQVNRKKYRPDVQEPEEVRRDNADYYATYVLGWSPVTLDGDNTYDFSHENVVALLLNPKYGRIFTQLLDFLANDATFTKSSAKA